ncbi:hypothetical protein B5C26_03325 [Photorhabdus luminescens]|nr:hypothetical protein B5C26_03325 [Photorhabdus luminescens]
MFMVYEPEKLRSDVVDLLEDTGKTLCFSAASIWEVVIKRNLNKPDFSVDPEHNKIPLITSDSKLINSVSDYITVIPNR